VRKVLAAWRADGYTDVMSPLRRSPCRASRPARFAVLAFAVIVGGPLAAPQAASQPRDRVDGTLPAQQAPQRGERVVGTRALREAGEARFRDELARQAELDALFNPHRAAWSGASMPIYPAVVPPYGMATGAVPPVGFPGYTDPKVPLPCPPGACPPPKPSPRGPSAIGLHDGPHGWDLRHRGR
jgi:hypothetical protein